MIKVGIIGAEQTDAGELLRLLIHHPEVEITTLYSPSYSGRHISACHHGFLGEEIISFSDKIDPDSLNVIFIADNSEVSTNLLRHSEDWEKLRLIDMSPKRIDDWQAFGLEYGLSEINRKPLVRGARLAAIPTAPAGLALIALYPLALQSLLDSDLEVTVIAPRHIAKTLNEDSISKEISTFISMTQTGFNGKVHVRIKSSDISRAMRVQSVLRCPLAIAEVDKIYEGVYDDHNFTFTSMSEIDRREVEGTQKCIVTFKKPAAGLLEVETIGDCHLRGGAGDALHVMNLFFALDEKVGLQLKPSLFGDELDSNSQQTSWFA